MLWINGWRRHGSSIHAYKEKGSWEKGEKKGTEEKQKAMHIVEENKIPA